MLGCNKQNAARRRRKKTPLHLFGVTKPCTKYKRSTRTATFCRNVLQLSHTIRHSVDILCRVQSKRRRETDEKNNRELAKTVRWSDVNEETRWVCCSWVESPIGGVFICWPILPGASTSPFH